ncbi:hypothetical protein V6N12_051109 [Hibiscus sabdariffa]|uniref:RNase H type-1 domain-containing protein n=1 Tax=Hibiscus sabdariffa TaxID=183260 RepID=A0ABR2GEM9_9ROSI
MNRHHSNHISSLKRTDNSLCTYQDELSEMAYNFYNVLFSSSCACANQFGVHGHFRILSEDDMTLLTGAVSDDRLQVVAAVCFGNYYSWLAFDSGCGKCICYVDRYCSVVCLHPETSTIVLHIRELTNRDWCVKVCHIPRGQNQLAHSLAKLASSSTLTPIYLPQPHASVVFSGYANGLG